MVSARLIFYSWILSSLAENAFSLILGKKTAYAALQALANAFGSISPSRQLKLHIELQSLKRNDSSVAECLKKAKSLSSEFGAAGRLITNAKFNANAAYHLDTTTTLQMTVDESSLYYSQPYKGSDQVLVGNGQGTLILDWDKSYIPALTFGKSFFVK